MPDLRTAKIAEERKLVARAQQQPAAAVLQFQRLSNAGVPVQAASILAKDFELLQSTIGILEGRIQALETAARNSGLPHLRKLERR